MNNAAASKTADLATWTATIARFAAPHVARGLSFEDAIAAAMADYGATLRSLVTEDRSALTPKGEAFAKGLAGEVWEHVRATKCNAR